MGTLELSEELKKGAPPSAEVDEQAVAAPNATKTRSAPKTMGVGRVFMTWLPSSDVGCSGPPRDVSSSKFLADGFKMLGLVKVLTTDGADTLRRSLILAGWSNYRKVARTANLQCDSCLLG
jgi:hypothetical protein